MHSIVGEDQILGHHRFDRATASGVEGNLPVSLIAVVAQIEAILGGSLVIETDVARVFIG